MWPRQQLPWNPILPVAVLAVTACVAMWVWLAARWRQGRPIVSYQPRRPVPWHAMDLAVVVVFYLVLQSGAIELASVVLGSGRRRLRPRTTRASPPREHVVGQLIAEGNVWVLLLCGISAAVVAPVSEEFFSACCCRAGWRRWSTVGGGRCRRCGD